MLLCKGINKSLFSTFSSQLYWEGQVFSQFQQSCIIDNGSEQYLPSFPHRSLLICKSIADPLSEFLNALVIGTASHLFSKLLVLSKFSFHSNCQNGVSKFSNLSPKPTH